MLALLPKGLAWATSLRRFSTREASSILDRYDQAADPQEWTDLEYVNWKSSGDTRFAPLASAKGEIEVNGFWNHKPPRPDKDGVWIDSQVAKAPNLVRRAKEPGANVGRCRVIELQPNSYADALYNMHQDDNNRLNPDGTGWVVRGYFNLSDDADSYLVLREDRFDPSSEVRIALPAGAQVIVDTQRLWHATWHAGSDSPLQPDHLVGVGPRPRRLHREVPRPQRARQRTPRPVDHR